MQGKDPIFELCDIIRETAFAIHRYHRNGHAEKIYENALRHRLTKQGIQALAQSPIKVFDEDGTILGDFFADLLVEQKIIVELKACRTVNDDHTAQVLGYLRATGIEHGLLINFGSPKLQVKKLVLSSLD